MTPTIFVQGLLLLGELAVLGSSIMDAGNELLKQLALCVATGRPWLGLPTNRRHVIVVNFADFGYHWIKSAKAIVRRLGAKDPSADWLEVHLCREGDPANLGLLRKWLRVHPGSLVVVDWFDKLTGNRRAGKLRKLLLDFPNASIITLGFVPKNNTLRRLEKDPQRWLDRVRPPRADVVLGLDESGSRSPLRAWCKGVLAWRRRGDVQILPPRVTEDVLASGTLVMFAARAKESKLARPVPALREVREGAQT